MDWDGSPITDPGWGDVEAWNAVEYTQGNLSLSLHRPECYLTNISVSSRETRIDL